MRRTEAIMDVCNKYSVCEGCPFKNSDNRYNVDDDRYICNSYDTESEVRLFKYPEIIDSILRDLGYEIDDSYENIVISEDDIMSLFSE